MPTLVSATYIYLFILFGAFLERAGMIQLFNDIALGFVGQAGRAGQGRGDLLGADGHDLGLGRRQRRHGRAVHDPADAALRIPVGVRGRGRGDVVMGGQIMPPVMGAVAFIMAENSACPTWKIVKAAIIPAIIYFGSAFWMVHLEAGKRGLSAFRKRNCRAPSQEIRRMVPAAAAVRCWCSC